MNLQNLVDIVRESRNLTALVFPLPDVGDCVDYAITEAGEYLDAVLRTKRQGDKRNNDKAHDERKEWGQCGYMIASAMMQVDEDWDPSIAVVTSVYTVLRSLCAHRQTGNAAWLADALTDWATISNENGWGATDLLSETRAAFERKHLPELFEAQHG